MSTSVVLTALLGLFSLSQASLPDCKELITPLTLEDDKKKCKCVINQACNQLETKKKENLTTPQITPTGLITNIYFSIKFMHLADTFIQSDLQCIQVIHFLSVCVFPGN